MQYVKSFLAFIIGFILLLFFYYYFSLPIIPAISIYAASLLFLNNDNHPRKTRITFVVLLTAISVCLYLANSIANIMYYSVYGNTLRIIFDIITAFACLGAGVTNISAHMK